MKGAAAPQAGRLLRIWLFKSGKLADRPFLRHTWMVLQILRINCTSCSPLASWPVQFDADWIKDGKSGNSATATWLMILHVRPDWQASANLRSLPRSKSTWNFPATMMSSCMPGRPGAPCRSALRHALVWEQAMDAYLGCPGGYGGMEPPDCETNCWLKVPTLPLCPPPHRWVKGHRRPTLLGRLSGWDPSHPWRARLAHPCSRSERLSWPKLHHARPGLARQPPWLPPAPSWPQHPWLQETYPELHTLKTRLGQRDVDHPCWSEMLSIPAQSD